MKKGKIAIDIGGTDIKGAIIIENEIFNKKSIPTNAALGVNAVKKGLDSIISHLLQFSDSDKIGISSAGNIDIFTGKVVGATDFIKDFNGFDIASFVREKFSKNAVIDNDAYCALLGEMRFGSAKNFKDVCMLTLGTGVGGAVALNGKILHGKDFIAGRFGHITLFPNGKKCSCGRFGCVEQYLSGTAFTKGAIELGYNITHGSEIFSLIKQGEKALEEYCDKFFDLLITVTESLINIYNPELLVIGGGLANSKIDWWEQFYINKLNSKNIEVRCAELGNNAGIFGASTLI
jgi:glucokinase